MTTLNRFRSYFDPETNEGIKLYNSAFNDFKCPLTKEELISLDPKNAQPFIAVVKRLARQYGYDYMVQNLPTTRVETPGLAEGDVPTFTYGGQVNMIEEYSAENIVRARKFATLVWGDDSFEERPVQQIRDLTNARSEVSNHNPPRLLELGKEKMRDRMHSKMMAHQLLECLTPQARISIELQKSIYTWTSPDGRDEEMDGLTILAIIMSRVKPHFKVDMFNELKRVKEITLKQHKNNLVSFFDEVSTKKVLIDQKDPSAYKDEAFVRDLLDQLKSAPIETFRLQYDQIETNWLMGKIELDSASLIAEATLHYTNLVNTDRWVAEYNPRDQIVALTTQIKTLEGKLKSAGTSPAGGAGTAAASGGAGYTPTDGRKGAFFAEWRLTKLDNGKEFGEVERDGKKWWWCEDGHMYNNVKCGMYVRHKPGQGHKDWLVFKAERNKERNARRGKREREDDSSTKPAASAGGGAKKMALSQQLQSALVTQAGLSEDQFKKIWDDACSQSGN